MKSIRMKWRGEDYVIPANRAFRAMRDLEEIVTLGQIGTWGKNMPLGLIAEAYATLLRFAGAKVTEEEVFEDIMATVFNAGKAKIDGDDAEVKELVASAAVHSLVACLMNGAPQQPDDAASDAPGKITAS